MLEPKWRNEISTVETFLHYTKKHSKVYARKITLHYQLILDIAFYASRKFTKIYITLQSTSIMQISSKLFKTEQENVD